MRDQRGFTMIELLVAISITGLIAGVLAGAIVTGLATTDDTRARIQETHEAQIVTVAFTADAQSADEVSLSDDSCAGVAPLVHFSWTDDGTQRSAAYAVRTVGGERVLTRSSCEDGAAPTHRHLARSLHDTTDPLVTCAPGACGDDPEEISLEVTARSGYVSVSSAVRRTA